MVKKNCSNCKNKILPSMSIKCMTCGLDKRNWKPKEEIKQCVTCRFADFDADSLTCSTCIESKELNSNWMPKEEPKKITSQTLTRDNIEIIIEEEQTTIIIKH